MSHLEAYDLPDVNVVDTQRQVGRADSSNSPIRLGTKRLLLVVGRGHRLDLVTMTVFDQQT